MAELVPVRFSTLLKRIYYEYTGSGAIFDLPKRKFYIPGAVDLSVLSCGNRAANPLGPAAGPHTQLAQNIVLSWLAGARIIELKTVQVNDRLELARPCIDMATVGYNTEWSQELTLEESAREYVKAGMIVDILKHWLFYSGTLQAYGCGSTEKKTRSMTEEAAVSGGSQTDAQILLEPNLVSVAIAGQIETETSAIHADMQTRLNVMPGVGAGQGEALTGVPMRMNLDTIFDVSVGYDLAGIQSDPIRRWLSRMQDASALIEELRAEIPDEFGWYRNLPFTKKISDSITLSTFHGTPAGEIERICEFLLEDMGFHVVVKMNPPMLGKERLEHLLHATLGYTTIEVNPQAYDVALSFADAAAMVARLQSVAARNKKSIGVKFGNTLEVMNKGTFLKDRVQYLSGQPLHVLHLALVKEWRKVFGPEFPISFSAGVDAVNFPDCVAIGLVPTTTCTDLLRPGGYGRIRQYLVNLEQKMVSVGATTIGEFIVRSEVLRAENENMEARSSADGSSGALTGEMPLSHIKKERNSFAVELPRLQDIRERNAAVVRDAGVEPHSLRQETYATAIIKNTEALLGRSMDDPRYRAANNNRPPRKVGSHLSLWDCLNCDKCIQVCPNDANFSFDVEPVTLPAADLAISADGWSEIDRGVFTIKKSHQIGTYADACNDCGNCDVFCPEDGGPYIEKPRFFGSMESYRRQHSIDGFVLMPGTKHTTLFGRFAKEEYELTVDSAKNEAVFTTLHARVTIDLLSHAILAATLTGGSASERVDLHRYFTMAALMKGMENTAHVHFVNAEFNHM